MTWVLLIAALFPWNQPARASLGFRPTLVPETFDEMVDGIQKILPGPTSETSCALRGEEPTELTTAGEPPPTGRPVVPCPLPELGPAEGSWPAGDLLCQSIEEYCKARYGNPLCRPNPKISDSELAKRRAEARTKFQFLRKEYTGTCCGSLSSDLRAKCSAKFEHLGLLIYRTGDANPSFHAGTCFENQPDGSQKEVTHCIQLYDEGLKKTHSDELRQTVSHEMAHACSRFRMDVGADEKTTVPAFKVTIPGKSGGKPYIQDYWTLTARAPSSWGVPAQVRACGEELVSSEVTRWDTRYASVFPILGQPRFAKDRQRIRDWHRATMLEEFYAEAAFAYRGYTTPESLARACALPPDYGDEEHPAGRTALGCVLLDPQVRQNFCGSDGKTPRFFHQNQ